MHCPVKNRRTRMVLSDDGTMDTVFACAACGREYRFNYDGEGGYAAFKKWARDDAAFQHESES